MSFFNKKPPAQNYNNSKSPITASLSMDSTVGADEAVNVFSRLLAANQISSHVVGVFNTEGGTAGIMTDLNVLCNCDRFGGDQCNACINRLAIMDSGPGDGMYAVHAFTHPDYSGPIGLFSIFDEGVSGMSIGRVLSAEEDVELGPQDFETDPAQLVIPSALPCYKWNTLHVDLGLYVADSTATHDEKTAILHFDAHPGEYHVAAICSENPDTIPQGFIIIHSDFAKIFEGLFKDLVESKSQLLAKTANRLVSSHTASVVEQAYAINRIMSMRAGDYDAAVSWLFCAVLDGYEEAIEIARENQLDVDNGSAPITLRRHLARALLVRGRLAKASEVYTSIIKSAPQSDPDEEIQRQATLNDFIFSALIPTGRIDEAIELANFALNEDVPLSSEKVNTTSNLAQLYYINGDFGRSLASAQSVLDHIAAKDYVLDTHLDLTGEANYWKGMSLIELGNAEAGRQCLVVSSTSSDIDYVVRAKSELAKNSQ